MSSCDSPSSCIPHSPAATQVATQAATQAALPVSVLGSVAVPPSHTSISWRCHKPCSANPTHPALYTSSHSADELSASHHHIVHTTVSSVASPQRLSPFYDRRIFRRTNRLIFLTDGFFDGLFQKKILCGLSNKLSKSS